MTATPTPPAPTLRPITLTLLDGDEPIGSAELRLVLTRPGEATDPGAWAITHQLGSIAGGTHTEVAFVDGTLGARDLAGDGSWRDPERERRADDLVRHVANAVYPGAWAFHYRPEQVPDAVLRHGSLLRERIEVSNVEVWA